MSSKIIGSLILNSPYTRSLYNIIINLIFNIPRAHVAATPCPGNFGVESYLILERVLMHLVQAKILLPAKILKFLCLVSTGTRVHCRLGYFLVLEVGLYFPRSFTNFVIILDFFAQITHFFVIKFNGYMDI